LKALQKEMADFGTDAGTAKGGGTVYKSPFSFELKNTARARAAKAAEAKKAGGGSGYRGVFWDYQFDGSIGVWAKPPSVESLSAAQQVSVRGISQAIQAQAGQQQITIQILGYNKDKMELARALAEELGRVARSPR
jgi:hypothetical protein